MALQRSWFKHARRDFERFASQETKRIGTWPYLTFPWVIGCLTRFFVHFFPYFLFFRKHLISPFSIVAQMDQVVDLDSPATWARVIVERATLFKRVMPTAMENFSIVQHWDTLRYAHTQGENYKPKVRQFDVGDFVYLQWQPNDTINIFSGCTILRIKMIRPSSVLGLQGANGCTIQDHSKNYAPYHLLNLDPTIITSTWIPPLDYPCQVCLRTYDVNQMLLCDNYNGRYHLFCLKPKLTQVSAGIWYYSSCSSIAHWCMASYMTTGYGHANHAF